MDDGPDEETDGDRYRMRESVAPADHEPLEGVLPVERDPLDWSSEAERRKMLPISVSNY
jgi:hypothetical protein